MRVFPVLVFILFAGAASAQQVSRQQLMEIRNACQADVRKLCANVQPGGGRLLQCLQQNAANVSLPCTEKLAAMKAGMQ